MTSPFLDEPGPQCGRDAQVLRAENVVRAFLQDLVIRVQHHRETPLQEGIDAARIVWAAWQSFTTADMGGDSCPWRDGTTLPAALTELVNSSLAEDRYLAPNDMAEASLDRPRGQTVDQLSRESFRRLTVWLEQGLLTLRCVHPRALEILGLRLEGCTDREIAQRLGLGLRLVQHLVCDLRQAWKQIARQE